MSSTVFSIELIPDPRLRRVVIGCALLAFAAGLVMMLMMPFHNEWKAAAAVLWSVNAAIEFRRLTGGYRDCRRIRFEPDGEMHIVGEDGCCTAATTVSGSVVFQRLAWLRIVTVDGRRIVELIRPRSAQDKVWRRFQVVWRHLGAGP